MTTAAEIMHANAVCVGAHETLADAALHMRELGVGALPICGDDNRLHGMLTDRDIVVKCVAAGLDPRSVTAGKLAQNVTYHVDLGTSVEDMLALMEQHQVRRLPVVDKHRRMVGIVSEADIARNLPEHLVAEFVRAVCAPQAVTSS